MTLQELNQFIWLRKEIKEGEARLEKLRSALLSPSQARYGVRVSGKGGKPESRTERYLMEIEELEQSLEESIAECIEQRNRIVHFVSEIPDSHTRLIFMLRFFDGLEWWEVAKKLGGGNTPDAVKVTVHRPPEE